MAGIDSFKGRRSALITISVDSGLVVWLVAGVRWDPAEDDELASAELDEGATGAWVKISRGVESSPGAAAVEANGI